MPLHPRLVVLVVTALLVARVGDASAATVRSAAGAAPEIQAAVDAFRADLGDLNANTAGAKAAGRREVNWDGVPPMFSDPNPFPPDFFNVNSPRGALFTTPGAGLRVSGVPARFGGQNAGYPTALGAFTAPKLFSPLGSNRTDLDFRVAGAATPATANGVGVVFTDVDRFGSSALELLDPHGASIGRFVVPTASGDMKFAFVGVVLTGGERVARVQIDAGDTPLGPPDVTQGGGGDVVAIDDVIYGEPQALGAVSTVDPAPVAETAGAATVTVTRSSTVGAGSVAYATAGGTATPGADYVPVVGRLAFADGEGVRTLDVPLVTDAASEPTETVGVALSAPRGALSVEGPAVATVTITDFGLKGAPPQFVAPLPTLDSTRPRVTTTMRSTAAVKRSRLGRGIAVIVGASEDGRLTARLRAGKRVLTTLAARPVRAGATALTLKVGRPARRRLRSTTRALVLEVTVTDVAGNAGRATRTIRLVR